MSGRAAGAGEPAAENGGQVMCDGWSRIPMERGEEPGIPARAGEGTPDGDRGADNWSWVPAAPSSEDRGRKDATPDRW